MVAVITLPKKLIKQGDLVLIPRSQYEDLLRISKKQTELDKGLEQSLKEARGGKLIGPFEDAKDLIRSLAARSLR